MAKKINGHTASTPVTSVEEYKVGPGRPPKEYQFKPGQSGNPKGRKRKPASLVPDLKRLFEQALAEKVTLKQGDKERILTMAEAGIKQLVAQFAKGDRDARRDVLIYSDKLGIDLISADGQEFEEGLGLDHQAILDDYVARQSGALATAASAPTLAPPDLIDDDNEHPE